MSAGRQIDYAAALWRRRWVIVPFMVLGMLGGLGAFQRMTRLYRAGATVTFIPQQISSKVYGSSRESRRQPPSHVREIRMHIASWPFLKLIASRMDVEDPGKDDLRDLRGRFEVIKLDQVNFRFTFIHRDPERAALGANTFATTFVEDHRRNKLDRAAGTLGFIQEEIDRISGELKTAERGLVTYQAEHKSELPADRQSHRTEQTVLRLRIADLDAGIENKRKDREQRLLILENRGAAGVDEGTLTALVPDDPRQKQIDTLRRQLADARLRYTDRHPQVIRLQASIDRLLEDIATNPMPAARHLSPPPEPENGDSTRRQAEDDVFRQLIRLEVNRLDTEIRDLEAKRQKSAGQIEELERLIGASFAREAEIDRYNSTIDLLRGRLTAKQGLQQTLQTDRQVLEREMDERYEIKTAAGVPLLPYRPDIVQLLLIGLLGGTAVGVGLALLLELMDRALHTVDEIEELVGVDVVACIQHMGGTRAPRGGPSRARSAVRDKKEAVRG